MTTIEQLKDWFSKGKTPTQEQFHELLDSYFHKDSSLPFDKVESLSDFVEDQDRKIQQLRSDLDFIYENHSREIARLRQRVERIEQILNL